MLATIIVCAVLAVWLAAAVCFLARKKRQARKERTYSCAGCCGSCRSCNTKH